MSSTEYSAMAVELTTDLCEHGKPMCPDCLTGAAAAWQALRDEHAAAMQAMRDEHFTTTTALRNDMWNLRNEHQQWKDNLSADACEHANRHNMCGEFDRFMEEHGLTGRTREYTCTVDVTVTVTVDVTATDESSAEELVGTYDVEGAVRSLLNSEGLSSDDYDVSHVEVSD